MSGGRSCSCEERRKPVSKRRWGVTQRRCNHSAFNGYHQTYSDWSELICFVCSNIWRTKAAYVDEVPNAGDWHQKLRDFRSQCDSNCDGLIVFSGCEVGDGPGGHCGHFYEGAGSCCFCGKNYPLHYPRGPQKNPKESPTPADT